MASPRGFAIANIDVSMLDDVKVRRLARVLTDPGDLAQALVVYLATVLESWSDGDRVSAQDVAPLWVRCGNALAALEQCHLLDSAGRVPEQAWEAWFGPARDRRAIRMEAGRKGGISKASRGVARAMPEQPSSKALPVPLTVPQTVRPSVPTGRRRTDGDGGRRDGPTDPDGPVRLSDLLPRPPGLERPRH